MSYVIRTDRLGETRYWAGLMDGSSGAATSDVISQFIFDAWHFESRKEAENVLAALGGAWEISKVSPVQSEGLQ